MLYYMCFSMDQIQLYLTFMEQHYDPHGSLAVQIHFGASTEKNFEIN